MLSDANKALWVIAGLIFFILFINMPPVSAGLLMPAKWLQPQINGLFMLGMSLFSFGHAV